jgi:hypothetical protein
MSDPNSNADANIFQVSASMAFFSWLICEHPSIWRRLGNLETAIIADRLDEVAISKPVYVSGLARSGSTILLEILNEAPGVVSQRYRDFPPVFTPYAWNTMLRYMSTGQSAPAERAHKDGIMVTQDSPEAMEEPLWMSFFPHAHDPSQSNVIMPGDPDQGFADFYRAHIRKLLAVHEGNRYLAKANYQITRLEYLLDLFPEARFVLPVREPSTHIASLMKQHELFARGQADNARARDHLRRVGHYEFGLDRVPINTGDNARAAEIMALWSNGQDVAAWAAYWHDLYTFVADRIEANPLLARATRLVLFEDLCTRPREILDQIFAHCELEVSESFRADAAARIAAPTYYKSKFSDAELYTIGSQTGETLERIRRLANDPTATPA